MEQMQQQMLEMQNHMATMMVASQQTHDRATRAEAVPAAATPIGGLPAVVTAAVQYRSSEADLVDTKLFTKPKPFARKEDDWAGWSFKMHAYVGALYGDMLSELTSAAAAATISDVLNTRLSAEGQARSRQLYYVLILMLAGPAL